MKKFYLFLTMLAALALPAALNAQVTAPYTQGFETMSTAEDLTAAGWELLYKSDAQSFLTITTDPSYVLTGAKALNIDSWSAGSSSDYVVVGLPLITNKDINELQITFSYKVSAGTVFIGYLTDANDGTTFVSLSDFNSSSVYTTKTVELNEAPASAVRIAIMYLGYYRCYMDDITVEELPNCFQPKSLAYSSVTAHEATLTWVRHAMGTENAWVLEYSTASDFSGATSVNVTGGTPSRTLTGLAPETQYYVRVKANCGGGDYSVWSEPVNFTTPVACPVPTALSAGIPGPTYVELSWTENGTASAWQLQVNSEDPIDITDNPYSLTGLTPATDYTVKVRANCGGGDGVSAWSSTVNFTTAEACPVPIFTDDSITHITGHTANVAWGGFAEDLNYTVNYRTKAHVVGISEEFATSSLPTGWRRYLGLLEDVLNGDPLTSAYAGWNFSSTYVFGEYHTKLNIYGASCDYWLVSPKVILPGDLELEFDLALTDYGSTNGLDVPTGQADDKFVVLITTDDGASWTILREWNNSGSEYVYNTIATAGEHVSISLAPYADAGETVRIAFYGESTVAADDEDNDLHIDNVVIGVPALVPAGAWQTINVTSPATSATITGLDPITEYEVSVYGECDGSAESHWSDTVTFTTDVACPAPTALTISNITNHSVVLGWTEAGSASAWQIQEGSNTPIDITENPYTLTGLTPNTPYTVKVRANCGGGDGVSAWSSGLNFTTLCDAVTSFPWTEDFEGLTDRTIPDCWDNTEGDVESNSYRWYYNINTSGNGATNGTSHDGSNCVCFNSFYPHEGKYDYLKTIPLSLPADPAMQLKFWYKNPKGGDYSVYISTDGGITYTTPLVTGLTGVSSWTQMTPIDLSAYAGQEVVLVFKGTSNFASGDAYIYLDDVTVEEKPFVCPVPTITGVSNLTAFTAMVTWNEVDGARWQSVCSATTVPDPENVSFGGESSTANSANFSTLSQHTDYVFYLRRDCGEGRYSDVVYTTFHTPEACPAPTDLVVSEITAHGATVSWTENGDATAWQICLNGDEANPIDADANPYTLTGLTLGADYTVKVRSNCGGLYGVSDWSSVDNFTTVCNHVTVFPWTEDFESMAADAVPDCWDNAASTVPEISTDPEEVWGVYSYDGNKMIRMHNWNVDNGIALINSPVIELPSEGAYVLSFDYAHNASCGAFTLKISTDGGSSFTDLKSYNKGVGSDHSDPEGFSEAYISLAAYAGESVILQFSTHADLGGGAIFVDNISIEEGPACLNPNALEEAGVALNSATLRWSENGAATAWQICLDGDEEHLVNANTNPFTVGGLTAATTYAVKVRAYCSAEDQSEWSDEIEITTACEALTVDAEHPFVEDFEGETFPPACIRTIRSVSVGWEEGERNHTAGGERNASSGFYGDAYLVLPYLTIADDHDATTDVRLTFWSYNEYPGDYDKNSVVLLDGGETELWSPVSVTSGWEKTTIDLTAYKGQTIRFAFKYEGNYAHIWNLDDIRVAFSCPKPDHIAVGGVSDHSAILSWTGNSESYNVRYREAPVFTSNVVLSEDFESYANTTALKTVWTLTDLGDGNNTYKLGLNSTANMNGSFGFQFSSYDGEDDGDFDQYLISPELTGSGVLEFYHKSSKEGFNETFRVGYSSTTNDLSEFTWGDEIESDNSWEIFLDTMPEGTKYFAINYTSVYLYYLYVDDITVHEVIYDTWETLNGKTTPCTVTGLDATTRYEAEVQGKCDEDDLSKWSAPVSFTTQCEAIASLPWSEDFEGFPAATLPTCWDNSTSTSITITEAPKEIWGVYESGGNRMIRMYNYGVAVGTALINSPIIELTDEGSYTLYFDYAHNADCGDFTVRISEDFGVTFTDLASYSQVGSNAMNPGVFTPAEISLADYAGQKVILQFFANANFGSGAIFVDNLQIKCDPITVNVENSFTEGFEGSFPPACWDTINAGNKNWKSTFAYYHSGSNSAYSGYYGDIYLMMPELTIEDDHNANSTVKLTFWSYNTYPEDYDKNSVVLLDGGETELWSPLSVTASWVADTVDLTTYKGQTIRLAFKYEGDFAHGWYIDDAKVLFIVPCADPTDLAVNDVAAYSAELGWTAGGEETVWQICLNGDEAHPIEANSNPFTVEGLDPVTDYTVKVRASCGGENFSDWTAEENFTTLCGQVTSFPWKEDFNSLTVDYTIPVCWDNDEGDITDADSKWCYNTSSSGDGAAHNTSYDGTNCVRFDSYNTWWEETNYLKTPTLRLPASPAMELSFWYKNPEDVDFAVYISTDGGTTHTTPLVASVGEASEWTEYEAIDLSAYAGQDVVIVFEGISLGQQGDTYIYLDDVTVGEVPSCRKPFELVAENIGRHQADLHWTSRNDESEWTIYWKESGALSYTEVSGVTNNPYTLTGLDAHTDYQFYVVANCSALDESVPSHVAEFTTLCESISVFPWTEDFESFSNSDIPECWDNTTSTSPHVQHNYYPFYPQYVWGVVTASGSKRIRMYDGSIYTGTALINTPTFDLPAVGVYVLSFDYTHRATCGDFSVKISDDNGETFTTLASYGQDPGEPTASFPGSFNTVEITLAPYAGQSVILQFYAEQNDGSGAIFVDNVHIEEAPPCLTPTALAVPDTTSTTVTLSWTESGSATSWQIMLNDDEENLIEATTNPFTIEGLTPITAYTAKVRAKCEWNNSDWSTEVSFTTKCGSYLVDAENSFTEDFEGSFPSTCWSVIDNVFGEWSKGNYANHTELGSYSAYSSYYGDTYLVMPHLEIDDDHKASTQVHLTLWSYNTYPGLYNKNSVVILDGGETELWSPVSVIEDWVGDTVDLTAYKGHTIQLAFKYEGDDAHGWYLDDVEVAFSVVACKNLTASAITTTSAQLNWTAASSETSWQICINGDEEHLVVANANPFTLTGLPSGTVHRVKVRAFYSESEQSAWSNEVEFTTLCAAITAFPWHEDFEGFAANSEGIDLSHLCWVNEHISGDGTKLFRVYTGDNAPDEQNPTHMLILPDMAAGTKTKLVLPEMNIPSDDYYFFIDVYRNDDVYNQTNYHLEGIRVYASPDGDLASATELAFIPREREVSNAVIPAEATNGWYTYKLPLGTSGTTYIILRGESQYNYSTYMDNFAVKECNIPVTAIAKTICENELPYTWNGVTFAAAGTKDTLLTAANGCDSIVTMTLTVNPTYSVTDERTVASSELPLTWNGKVFATHGTQTATLQSVGECDSVVTMTLTVNYVVSATADPSAGGTLTGAGSYSNGTTATLTASANEGFSFVNWTQGGVEVSTEPTYSFTVVSDSAFVANFDTVSHTIAVSADPAAGGVVTGGGSYKHFTTATLTATANEGYTFVGWKESGSLVSPNATYSFMVTEDVTLVADFDTISHTITATGNPAVGGNVFGGGSYKHFTTATLTVAPNTGYEFVNWTQGGSEVSTNPTYSFTVTEDAAFVANFDTISYTIAVSANPAAGGVVTGGGSYKHFTMATLTATPNEGYTFVGWKKGGTLVTTNPTYSFTVTEAGDYVAHFSLNSYEITATSNPVAGATISGAGTYNHGETATLTATPNEGYTFVNWTKGGTEVSTNLTYSFTVTGAGDYVANFLLNSYTITATVDPVEGGYIVGGNPVVYNHGETATLEAEANPGYEFVNWTKNGVEVSTNATYTFTVTGAGDYVANFDTIVHPINVSANPAAGGVVTGGGDYKHFTTATLTATPNVGYEFVNWTKNGVEVSTNATYSFTVNADADYVANFDTVSYTIAVSANPVAGGVVTGGGSYKHFTTATLTATANEGYTFVNWKKNGAVVSNDATYSFMVVGAGNYEANFSLNSYEITVAADPNAGGVVTGAGTYNHGATATLTATANPGYTFVRWTKNGVEVSTNPTYSFTVTGAGDYMASFSLNSYTITAAANPVAGGTITGAGIYHYGETATLTTTANEGYSFRDWTKGGLVASPNATFTFTVTEAGDYVANFDTISHSIAVSADPAAGGVVTGGGSYKHFTTATLTATPNPGYNFSSWRKNGAFVTNNATYSFTVTGDANYVANFTEMSTVETPTFAPEAGTYFVFSGGTQLVHLYCGTTGATIYYTLDGTTPTNESSVYDNYLAIPLPLGETTVKAIAIKEGMNNSAVVSATYNVLQNYHIIIAGPIAHGTVTCNALTAVAGATVTLTSTADAGYHFGSWNVTSELGPVEVTGNTFVMPAADVTISATFLPNSYAINATAIPAAGGNVAGAGNYDYNTTATLIATPNTGYHFVNWTVSGSEVSTDATYSFTVTGSANIVANFEINTYTLSVAADPVAGGTVTGDGTYTHGQEATLTATPNAGYHFVRWNDGSITNPRTVEVHSNNTFIAFFELNTYEITATANPAAGGVVSGADTYTHGQTVTLTATANTGYTFTNWTKNGDVVSTNPTYSFTATGAGDYVANFSINTYTLSVIATPLAGGTTTGSGNFTYGTIDTLTATPNTGYHFVQWNDGNADNPRYVEVIVSTTFIATFELNSYAITATANPAAGGTVSGADTYNYGATATLTATANTGYTFTNWTKGGEVVSTNPTYSFEVTEAGDYVANFTAMGTVATPTFSPAAGTYNVAQNVTISCATAGATIYYTVDGTEPTTSSAVYESAITVSETATLKAFAVKAGMLNSEVSTATYTIVPLYSITVDGSIEHGTVTASTATAEEGATITLTATPATGYHFGAWNVTSTLGTVTVTDNSFVMPAANVTVSATFEPNSYTITATANPAAGGTVSGAGTYNYGATATLTATANTGYTFTNWTKGGVEVSTNATYSFEVTEAGDYVANFTAMGTVATPTFCPAAGTYHVAQNVTISCATAGATIYYTVDGTEPTTSSAVYESAIAVSETATLKAFAVKAGMLNSAVATATYTIVPLYSITVDGSIEHGTVTASAATAEAGDTITLTATPATGYHFGVWNVTSTLGTVTVTDNSFVMPAANVTVSATFEPNSYTITYVNADTTFATATYEYGAAVAPVTAPEREGYTFAGWNPEVPTTMPANDVTVVAQWTVNSYTITYVNADTTFATATYEYGAAVAAVTAPEREGYTFAGWNPEVPATMPANDVTVVAQWTVNSYTITYVNADTTFATATYAYGAAVATVTAPEREGYTFAGWNPEVPSTMPANDVTVVAQWTINSYTITATANPTEGGTVTGADTYNYGATATLTATANEGYEFVNWTKGTEVVSADASYTFTVTEAGDYVANFAANTYTLTYLDGNDTLDVQTYAYGATITAIAEPTKEGYTFNGWNPALPETMPAENLTVNAQWMVNEYTITYMDGNNVLDVQTYDFGATVTAIADPTKTGHTFTGWDPEVPEIMPAHDVTVFAQWQINSYTVTVVSNNDNMGTVTGSGTFIYGSLDTLTATAFENHIFIGWNDLSTESTRVITVNRDITFTAYFIPEETEEIEIPVNDTVMGSVELNFAGGGGENANLSSMVEITATPEPHYHFVSWSDGNTENPRMVTLMEALNLTAIFAIDQHTITVLSADETMGTVSVGGTYDYGTEISISADALPNHVFVAWNDGNTENPRNITVEQDSTFTAFFQVIDGINEANLPNVNVFSHENVIVVVNAEGYSVEIFDMSGRLIVSESRISSSESNYTIYAPGIYLVKVGENMVKKVTVLTR